MSRNLSPTELKRLHRDWRRRSDLRCSMILDGVQQPYNVGALIRSTAAYRGERIWAVDPTPDPTDPKVARTALGCDRFLEWERAASGPAAVEAARSAGFRVVGIELTDDATPMFELDLGASVCLVLGHEDRGIKKDTLAALDECVFLPQLGKVGSLNVAQAGTVALYEASRQRLMS